MKIVQHILSRSSTHLSWLLYLRQAVHFAGDERRDRNLENQVTEWLEQYGHRNFISTPNTKLSGEAVLALGLRQQAK